MPQTRSVSWFLLVHMMMGTSAYSGSRVIARVSWKPFWPGITTSIRIRSGFSSARRRNASSAFSAVFTAKPFFCSRSVMNISSVLESSTTSTFLIAIAKISYLLRGRTELLHGLQQLVLGERLGEVVLRPHHAATRLVEHAVLGGQHHHRDTGELGIALDDGAGLVAIETRHEDVAEDQVRLVVVDLGQRIETVFGQHHFVAALLQKDFGAAADRVAVIDHQHLEPGRAHVTLLLMFL